MSLARHVRSKYPIRIVETLVPRGTVGEVPTLAEVQEKFPEIKTNLDSDLIAVRFPDLDWCIVPRRQVVEIYESTDEL